MTIDIAELTRSALIHSGCDTGIIEQLDSHSPIELNFKSHPAIYIVLASENQVRFESRVMADLQWDIAQIAANLLHAIVEPVAWSTSRATALVQIDGVLKLSASISEEYLGDGRFFADAIDGFYKRVVQVQHILHA
jgi:hypothetical protein